jgi:hypothetical protein
VSTLFGLEILSLGKTLFDTTMQTLTDNTARKRFDKMDGTFLGKITVASLNNMAATFQDDIAGPSHSGRPRKR